MTVRRANDSGDRSRTRRRAGPGPDGEHPRVVLSRHIFDPGDLDDLRRCIVARAEEATT